MRIIDLGITTYAHGEAVQNEAHAEVLAGGEEQLILARFKPVVTLGRNAGTQSLHTPPELLQKNGIDFYRASRGGDVTCHFPDQTAMYPIVRVDTWKGGLHGYFNSLEECIIQVLSLHGLAGERVEGRPGVWIGGRKIGSMGIAVKRWVARHGLSLNVGPDLSVFSHMTPCGLAGVEPTSMALELARKGTKKQTEALIKQVQDELIQIWQGIRAAS